MKLPDNMSLVRETLAAPGWFAYYADPWTKTISMLPVVLWVVVEYDDAPACYEEGLDPEVVEEIRPFVLLSTGRVTDAHEVELQFLCMLGPDVDHSICVERALKEQYPDQPRDDESQADASAN